MADSILQRGFPKVIVKTDQEPAILEVKREAAKLVRDEGGIEVVPEESQAYVSPTNGIAEQAIQAIERKVRTLKYSVEQLHGVKLPPNHAILPWCVEFAGQIESRMHRYSGIGRTAFELRRGKTYKRKLPPFGEKVAALTLGKKKIKAEYRTFVAIFVALAERSDMLIVLDEAGAHRVASVKRLSPESRADPALIDKVKGLPWRPKQAEPDATEVPMRISAEPVIAEAFLPPPLKLRAPELSKRQLYIRREHELNKYGLWPGCRGCDAARIDSQLFPPHSEECNARMLKHLAQEDEHQERNI